MCERSYQPDSTPSAETYESINEFVLVGEFGFHRVEGPFSVEKEGTLWTVTIPTDEEAENAPQPSTVNSLLDCADTAAVLIADGQAVGGGIVDFTNDLPSDGEIHIIVDQYAMGTPEV